MQTFLPVASTSKSAEMLDYRRLGKQRVETWQILNTLTGQSSGWANHPAVKMWRGHETALAIYGYDVCSEWIRQGYKDTLRPRFADFLLRQVQALDQYVKNQNPKLQTRVPAVPRQTRAKAQPSPAQRGPSHNESSWQGEQGGRQGRPSCIGDEQQTLEPQGHVRVQEPVHSVKLVAYGCDPTLFNPATMIGLHGAFSTARFPAWWGDESVHASHRSNLLRKDPQFYSAFGWSEPHDLPYVWPEGGAE